MPDREKVIRGLDCLSRLSQDRTCAGCAYFRPFTDDPDTGWCDSTEVKKDALALLREQEPTVAQDTNVLGKWVSVKDRLPEKDGEYLVYIDWRYCQLASFTTNKPKEFTFINAGYGWYDYDSDYGFYEVRRVTHWMPLPEPPEGVNKDG